MKNLAIKAVIWLGQVIISIIMTLIIMTIVDKAIEKFEDFKEKRRNRKVKC